jgi:hypothetical protein
MRASRSRAILGILVLTSGVAARAEDEPRRFHLFARHHPKKEGMTTPGRPRCIPHTHERAGYPREPAGHLEPSATPGGIGYYIGGGVPIGHKHFLDEGRTREDGTWGWDETGGVHCRRRVILGWSHGRKFQGGTGDCRTDGPVVPDLFYATTSALNSLGRREGGEGHE